MGFLDWDGLQKFWNKCKSAFVTKDENGDVTVESLQVDDSITCVGTLDVKEGYSASFWSDDNSKKASLRCDDNGKLSLNGKAVATVDDIPSGGSGGSRYSEGLAFTLNADNNSYSVSGIGTCTDTDIIIPSTYEGKPVTSIGKDAFEKHPSIVSVVIPDSVISIDMEAFDRCPSIVRVVIGNSVTSIGWNAFDGCSALTDVTIPDSVTSIGSSAFQDCSSLRFIVIPDSVTSMGAFVFGGCGSLTIYCEASSKPTGWDNGWNMSNRPVVWGAVTNVLDVNKKLAEIGAGDSSIIDLGEMGDHKEAQSTMVGHLEDEENGCYLFKYWCSCSQSACFAVVYKESAFIEGTVFDSYHRTRVFNYTPATEDFAIDGCWEQIATDGGGSGGATLSMPRIRLASHGHGEDVITCNKDSKEWFGSYTFSVEIMDGTVQEGDQLQICNLTNHKNSRGVRVRKPRRFSERVITAEDIEMLQYNPYLQILVEGMDLRELYRSCSSDGTLYRYPKYIRLRRPKYDEEGQETGATFSNVVCADVRLPVEFFSE